MNPDIEVINIETMSVLADSGQLGIGSSVTTAAGAESRECDDFDE